MDKSAIESALAAHAQIVESVRDSAELLIQMAEMIGDSIRAGGKVLVFGNGGSAADAQHITGELLGRFKRERPALATVALSTDTSTITAIGNDYGFEEVFSRQVQGLARSEDVVWGLTTSGSSANVVRAIEQAKGQKARTLGFSGGGGGKLAELADLCLVIPGKDTARVQEGHQLAYHIICDMVEAALAKDGGT